MRIHREWTKTPMSAIEFDQKASAWARRLEDREARRVGLPVVDARKLVARRIGVPAGTLENLRRGRSKGVRAWIVERIKGAVEREIEAEIRGLQHELEMVRRSGGESDRLPLEEMVEIEAALSRMRGLLDEGRRG